MSGVGSSPMESPKPVDPIRLALDRLQRAERELLGAVKVQAVKLWSLTEARKAVARATDAEIKDASRAVTVAVHEHREAVDKVTAATDKVCQAHIAFVERLAEQKVET